METNLNIPPEKQEVLNIKIGYNFEIDRSDFQNFDKIYLDIYEMLKERGARISSILIN